MSLKVGSISFKSTLPQQNAYFTTPQNQQPQQPQKQSTNSNLRTGGEILLGTAAVGLGVLAFTQRNTIKNLLAKTNEIKTQTTEIIEEKLIPYTVKNLKETSLYNAFTESKQGFLEFISSAKAPEKVKEFLFGITNDEKVSADFIREVTENPRASFQNTKILQEAIGGEKNLTEWLYAEHGYNSAYEKYMTQYADNPYTTLEDMMKVSPNWHLFKLLNKTGINIGEERFWKPENLQFGKLPEEFTKLGDFRHFSKWLVDETNAEAPKLLEYGGMHFKAKRLTKGMSNKVPVKIEFCDPQGKVYSKPYILKKEFAPEEVEAHISQAYRSDSNFLDAQIDYYLNLNKCEHATPFHYYDFHSDTAIYEFVSGTPYTGAIDLIGVNKHLKDLNRLGVFYNDANTGNFLVQDGVTKIIDIGESLFHDALRPPVQNLHFELPNWAGKKLPNFTLNKILGE